jgi:hypothetical protein
MNGRSNSGSEVAVGRAVGRDAWVGGCLGVGVFVDVDVGVFVGMGVWVGVGVDVGSTVRVGGVVVAGVQAVTSTVNAIRMTRLAQRTLSTIGVRNLLI